MPHLSPTASVRSAGRRSGHSQPASAGSSFRRTLEKTGTYRIIRTLHEEMKMTITVRR